MKWKLYNINDIVVFINLEKQISKMLLVGFAKSGFWKKSESVPLRLVSFIGLMGEPEPRWDRLEEDSIDNSEMCCFPVTPY